MTEEARKWKQVPWLRIGAEAVAIIASILIAFSLDAWWDGRQLAETEQEYLVSLDRDFRANQTSLRRTIQIQDTVLQSIQELVVLGAATRTSPDAERVRSLIQRVFRDTNVGFTPNIGTYRELLNTSSLQVLRNDSLRILLSDFDVALQTVVRVEEEAGDRWNMNVDNHLLTRLDFAALLPADMLGSNQEPELRASDIDLRDLVRDRVFSNIMVGRLAVTAVRLSMYRDLEFNINEILGVLARDLVQ
jgi:hypothetical protein